MDKRTIIGFVLIFLVVILMYTPFYQRLIVGDRQPEKPIAAADSQAMDTTAVSPRKIMEQKPVKQDSVVTEELEESAKEESIAESTESQTIQIESDVVIATVSNEDGGAITNWKLKNYKEPDKAFVNIINENGLDVELTNSDGKRFNLRDYSLFIKGNINKNIVLNEKNPVYEVEFYLPIRNGQITKKMIFYFDKYSVDVIVKFERLNDYVINGRYFFSWENGLESTEENAKEDYSYAQAYASMAGELEDLDVSKTKKEEKSFNGMVDWTAIRTKYFLVSLIPNSPRKMNGAIVTGVGESEDDHVKKVYSISLDVPFTPSYSQSDTFTTYLGPLDYGILKSYERDLQSLIMNRGWYERLFRPIALLVLPILKFFHSIIPNYGVVIIIFSILIKLILHPLTKKSYKSMSEMQYFQPKIAELREKYKNEPQRMQKEMMKFYKEHGINPLGGCLPTLLQMPLLVSLFIVFRSTIQLRGQPFMLWIDDLSRPDNLFIGMNLPFLGDTIHVLPILMGITMIWQSKMNITDPKQKMLAYFMPIFMIFIFYSFPSGLNLYYSLFNLFSMVQTRRIKQKMHPGQETEQGKPDSKKPAPKKNWKGRD